MNTYDRKVAQWAQHSAMLDEGMAALVREGEELINLQSALKIAFHERTGREFNDRTDTFTLEDEQRGNELLLVLFPEAGA